MTKELKVAIEVSINKIIDDVKDTHGIDLSKLSDKQLSTLIYQTVRLQALKLDIKNEWC